MDFKAITASKWFTPALGAALAVLGGLALRSMPLGEAWVNASYDYLFRFAARPVTNQLVLVMMDDAAYAHFGLARGNRWDRALHARFLNRLAVDACPLVVIDTHFDQPGEPAADAALAEALRRQRQVALMADLHEAAFREAASAQVDLPAPVFLQAARTNWGVAHLDPEPDAPVRRHWPFPSSDEMPSLPWTAARLMGARLEPAERWLRYHGEEGAWTTLSYALALDQPTNYFRGKTVFIGSKPHTTLPGDDDADEFRTPYTRWTHVSAGGVEILATEFLNLVNGDWLRRPAWWVEALVLVTTGILLGGGLGLVRMWPAGGLAAGAALGAALGAVSLSYFTNYWFPWLIIAGGQAPGALAWALAWRWRGEGMASRYEVAAQPFGNGAYGAVFLARHRRSRRWFALKRVYRAQFNGPEPYEREFRGITRYLPVSSQHPGLLHVHYVERDEGEGNFFYVMDLGDAQVPAWERNPALYKPRDLHNVRDAAGGRLPVRECVRIGLALAEALEFLHAQGLVHRDIKPQNIIFVQGQPKFADVGLVAEIRRPEREGATHDGSRKYESIVGTWDYMPPAPELPGTPSADIYSLGKVLYVISTGHHPDLFPELSTALVEQAGAAEFILLNAVFLKAAERNIQERYGSAVELRAALKKVEESLERNTPTLLA